MTEENNSQVSLNAEAFSRDASDDESALRSNWGSDDDSTECLGDGRPRGDPDGLRDEPQALDEHQGLLLPQSGAQAPDFIRVKLVIQVKRSIRFFCMHIPVGADGTR